MPHFIQELFKKPIIRFLFAGGINTVFSYCSFAIIMFLTDNKEFAVTLNLFVAVAFNYLNSAKFVFKKKSRFIDIIKFYIVYFITYPINLLHLHITVDVCSWNVYLSQLITLLYMPFISFFLQRTLIFKNKEKDGK